MKNLLRTDLLRILMGIVFLSAGFFRILFPMMAQQELLNLHLPSVVSWFIVLFEIVCGVSLLMGKYVRFVCVALMGFLGAAILWGLFLNYRIIIQQAGELFVFNLNPTDIFLHFVFVCILISVYFSAKKS